MLVTGSFPKPQWRPPKRLTDRFQKRPLGLPFAGRKGLRGLVEKFGQRTRIQVEFKSDLAERLHGEIETHLFRITQESLTNVARHSSAKKVSNQQSNRDGMGAPGISQSHGFEGDRRGAAGEVRRACGIAHHSLGLHRFRIRPS